MIQAIGRLVNESFPSDHMHGKLLLKTSRDNFGSENCVQRVYNQPKLKWPFALWVYESPYVTYSMAVVPNPGVNIIPLG